MPACGFPLLFQMCLVLHRGNHNYEWGCEMLKIVISGAAGRMGVAIARELYPLDNLTVVGALERTGSDVIGRHIGEVAGLPEPGIRVTDRIENLEFDVMIDFSNPAAVADHLKICQSCNAAILIGTTGLDQAQSQRVVNAGDSIPALLAANTSVGINLCVALVEMASKVIGDYADIEVVEAHHRHKADAPSGTALLLGKAAARVLERDFPGCGTFARHGQTGEREAGTIGFSTIRGGDIAGEHTVLFIGESERVEITHRATDRKIFARGAVRAASWLAQQKKGFYSMRNVLDLD